MPKYTEILEKIRNNERYKKNIQYGKPRHGHAEGTVEAHIKELEQNLLWMLGPIYVGKDLVKTNPNYLKLLILIHVHDSFKAESGRNLPIEDPKSHASLAREFLSHYTNDQDMLAIVQQHDLAYAVYRNYKDSKRHTVNYERLEKGLSKIKDLNLYLLFCIIDSCTKSKGREMITWFVKYVHEKYNTTVDTSYILPGGGEFVEGQTW